MMKNFKMFMLAAGVAIAASFTSCDRDEYTRAKDKSGIAGSYNVSQYNVPVAIDLNGDGASSTNLVGESPCFTNTFLRFNDDHTFKLAEYFPNGDSGVIVCDSIITAGVWRRNDAVLTTTIYTDNGVRDVNFAIGADGAISKSLEDGSYPVSDGAGGFYTEVGTLNMVYTR